MKEHVDALGKLLSKIDRLSLGALIKADDELRDIMSIATEAVQNCSSILKKI